MPRASAAHRSLFPAVVVALLATACTSTSSPETAAPTAATTVTTTSSTTTTLAAPTTTVVTTTTADPLKPSGGVVAFGIEQEPETLNPLIPGGARRGLVLELIGQLWWAGVSKVDAMTNELVPDVVETLPTMENDGATLGADGTLTVRYVIREEAVWSDGTPITGSDLEFTLETILDPSNNVDTSVYEDIISYSADGKTFEYTLAIPTIQYQLLFDVILPKHDVEGTSFTDDWNTTTWVSGGPFVFEEWIPGRLLRFSRNDNYWRTDGETGQPLPFLDGVEMRVPAPGSSLIDLFLGGDVDVIDLVGTRGTADELSRIEEAGGVVETVAAPGWEHIGFQFGPGRLDRNTASLNPFLDYRRAVAHALDRDRLVDEISPGRLRPIDSFVDVFAPELSTGAWSQYDYDPDRSRELVEKVKAEAGVDEIVASFTTTAGEEARVALAAAVGEMLGEVGIDVEVTLEDDSEFIEETLRTGSWDLAAWAWVARGPGALGLLSIVNVFDPERSPPLGLNYYRWGTEDSSVQDESTAAFAAVRDTMNETLDPAAIVPLLAEAESLLADNLVMVPLYQRIELSVHRPAVVTGIGRTVSGPGATWNAAEWYLTG